MNTKNIILITFIFLSLSACKNKDENGSSEGKIVGFVKLLDKSGNETSNYSGVNVSIVNTTYQTVTNNSGRFELEHIPAGTYNIEFRKEGFGSYKNFSFQHIAGEVSELAGIVSLYQQPLIEIKTNAVSFDGVSINVSGTISATDGYSLQIFLNDSSNISNTNYDYTENYSLCCTNTTEFQGSVYLSNTIYSIGDTIFLILYFKNLYETSPYNDPINNVSVYTSSTKATEVIDFKIE